MDGQQAATSHLRWLELVTSYAAAIAALGYMSLRAFVNYLGLPTPQLTFERFLMESYTLAFETLAHLLLIAGAVLVLSPVWLLVRRLVHRKSWTVSATWLAHTAPAVVCGVLAFAAAIALLVGASAQFDVIVGPLDCAALTRRAPWLYDAALVVAAAGAALWHFVRRAQPPAAVRWIWRLSIIPWLTVVALTPLLYGQSVRRAVFLRCEVVLKSQQQPAIQGLLIESTEKRLLVWHAIAGNGRVESIALDDVDRFTVGGSADILQEAKCAVRSAGSPCNCDRQ